MRTPAYTLGFVLGIFAAQGVQWMGAVLVVVCAVDLVRWALA